LTDCASGSAQRKRWTAGADVRAALGTVLYLTLIGVLSLGVAAAVRDSAVAIGLVLGLLYLFPIVTAVVSNATIARHLQQIGPMSAGLDIQATIGVQALPLTPWQGLGVVCIWTAGAVLLGALGLRLRGALPRRPVGQPRFTASSA
jgi:ABC-2 type transport system permease protein